MRGAGHQPPHPLHRVARQPFRELRLGPPRGEPVRQAGVQVGARPHTVPLAQYPFIQQRLVAQRVQAVDLEVVRRQGVAGVVVVVFVVFLFSKRVAGGFVREEQEGRVEWRCRVGFVASLEEVEGFLVEEGRGAVESAALVGGFEGVWHGFGGE